MRHQDAVSRGWLLHQPGIGVKKKNIGMVVLKSWYLEREEQGRYFTHWRNT